MQTPMPDGSPRRHRVAVYGGSFDPVHIGHTLVASATVASGAADEVWLMVARRNPLKESATMASDAQRLEMVRIATAPCPELTASDFEFSLPSPSYTATTLDALAAAYPSIDFRLLTGADNWIGFDRWHRARHIIERYGVIVYPRPGIETDADSPPVSGIPAGRVSYLDDVPRIQLSSTLIRQWLAKGRDCSMLLPAGVTDYIRTKGLYGISGTSYPGVAET